MAKELIWNDDRESVDELYDVGGDFEVYANFKIGFIYFSVLRNKKTGELIDGWTIESEFDDCMPNNKREDFEVIPIEEVIKLLKK